MKLFVLQKTMKILTSSRITVVCAFIVGAAQISSATQTSEQINSLFSNLAPEKTLSEDTKNTDNNFSQQFSTANNSINDLFDGEFKKPYPVRKFYRKEKFKDFEKPDIENVCSSCTDIGTYITKNISEVTDIKTNKEKVDETKVVIVDDFAKKLRQQQDSASSVWNREQLQTNRILAEPQNVEPPKIKEILGKKRLIGDYSNSEQLDNFLNKNLDMSDSCLEKQIVTLSKFVRPDPNDYFNFHKDKNVTCTIHTLTQEICQRFFLKPVFLFKFSHTTTSIDKNRRFSCFWKVLLMHNAIFTKKISYINEQKQVMTIDINDEILINRVDNILKKYISNSERTINKIIQFMKNLKHLDATSEYEMDQVKFFIHVLQNISEIRKISWNITLSDGSASSTIGNLFDVKLQPILNEYFTALKSIVELVRRHK